MNNEITCENCKYKTTRGDEQPCINCSTDDNGFNHEYYRFVPKTKVYEFNEPCSNEIGDKVKFPFTKNVPQLGKTFMYSYDGIVYKCINISSEYVIGEIVDFVEINLNN